MCELMLQMILLCNCSLSLNICNVGLQGKLRFLRTTVFQGSVVTQVNDGRIFKDFFIAEYDDKRIWKIRIWQSYGKK